MSEQAQATTHVTVLLQPAVDALVHKPDGRYLDCTFGRGGHSALILQRLGSQGALLAIDRDPDAVAVMKGIQDARFVGKHAAFAELDAVLDEVRWPLVDGVLMDLGVSSPQLDVASRGFSFRHDGPLDMRMDNSHGESVAAFLAKASVQELTEVIKNYGEERFAFQIATAIVARRQTRPIESTRELAQIVAGTVRTRQPGQDPATRTFQALRIHINQELAQLEQGLSRAFARLAPGGRLVVIAFHSLEDRLVKQFMDNLANPKHKVPLQMRKMPLPDLPVLARKVMRAKPSDVEVQQNPRSRSAVMRVLEKLPEVAQ